MQNVIDIVRAAPNLETAARQSGVPPEDLRSYLLKTYPDKPRSMPWNRYLNLQESIKLNYALGPEKLAEKHKVPRELITTNDQRILEYWELTEKTSGKTNFIEGFKKLCEEHNLHVSQGCSMLKVPGTGRAGVINDHTYILYLPEYDIYKAGVSSDVARRCKQFGPSAKIVWQRDLGTASILVEQYMLYKGMRSRIPSTTEVFDIKPNVPIEEFIRDIERFIDEHVYRH